MKSSKRFHMVKSFSKITHEITKNLLHYCLQFRLIFIFDSLVRIFSCRFEIHTFCLSICIQISRYFIENIACIIYLKRNNYK